MVSTGGATCGNNNLVPLKDAATTNTVVAVKLSGTKTLRYDDGSGDFDFLLFAPAGGAPPSGPQITATTLSGGNLTITWTGGGSLQTSTDLSTSTGWTDVPNSTGGTYTTPATDKVQFFRVKQ